MKIKKGEITKKSEAVDKSEIAKKEETIANVNETFKQLKRQLKKLSKSQLIALAINYAGNLQEMQEVAKQLYEENIALKGAADEDNN